MSTIAIKDIYAGMPDAKDEVTTDQADKFFASFIVPPGITYRKPFEWQKVFCFRLQRCWKNFSFILFTKQSAVKRFINMCFIHIF